jgi:hypothetical protein
MSVERFDPYSRDDDADMWPSSEGLYVSFADYHALQLQMEGLKADAERWRWMRKRYAMGEDTYFAESCPNTEDGIDAEVDARRDAADQGNQS